MLIKKIRSVWVKPACNSRNGLLLLKLGLALLAAALSNLAHADKSVGLTASLPSQVDSQTTKDTGVVDGIVFAEQSERLTQGSYTVGNLTLNFESFEKESGDLELAMGQSGNEVNFIITREPFHVDVVVDGDEVVLSAQQIALYGELSKTLQSQLDPSLAQSTHNQIMINMAHHFSRAPVDHKIKTGMTFN